MAENITIKIATDGTFEYAVSGVKGRKCRDLTKFIDTMANVKETKVTGEYCQIEQGQQQKQGR